MALFQVLCTPKEYNKYTRYTKTVQLSWEMLYYEQQVIIILVHGKDSKWDKSLLCCLIIVAVNTITICASQKKLLKDFLTLKEKGGIPCNIHLSDMRDWLVHSGADMCNKM